MKTLIDWLIGWPERVAQHLGSSAPLFARIVVGWVFLWSGWGKLNNLPAMIENFASWHIPAPHILTPFVSGVEFFGGIFLLLYRASIRMVRRDNQDGKFLVGRFLELLLRI